MFYGIAIHRYKKIVVPLHTYYIYNNEIQINNNYFNRLPVHNG